jgi:hypothetical protein
MTSDLLYVFKNNRDKSLVGRIVFAKDRITFTYAKSYTANSDSVSINPFYLPLNDQQRTFIEPELNGVLTVFKDALPGKWGSYVIEKVKGKVAGEGQSRTQSLVVGHYGAEASIRNALSNCDAFALSPETALEMTEDIVRKIQLDWKNVFRNAGVSPETIVSIEWAVLHDEIFIDFEYLKLPT